MAANIQCPWLPAMAPDMTWRNLRSLRDAPPQDLYLALLRYTQKLWRVDSTARAILALDRALLIRLPNGDPILDEWPTPYAALHWMLTHHDGSSFLGNPRRHYQHLAGRVSGNDAERKRWVAWACWYISRQTLQGLEPDTLQNILEPAATDIASHLTQHGIAGEAQWWLAATRSGPIIEPERWPVATTDSIASR